MNSDSSHVSFRLLKKTYEVTCPPEQRKSFDDAVKMLKQRVRNIHDHDANAPMDQIAVVAALNISHDYLKFSQAMPDDLATRLDAQSQRIKKVLEQARNVKFS